MPYPNPYDQQQQAPQPGSTAPAMGAGQVVGAQMAGTLSPSGSTRLGPTGSAAALQDPGLAYQAYRNNQGLQGRNKSRLAGFQESLFGQALSALLNLQTTDNPGSTIDNVNDIIGKFGQQVKGGNLFGGLQGAAGAAANRINLGNYEDPDVEKILKMIAGLYGVGQSPIGASGIQSQLDDLLYAQDNRNIADDFSGTSPLGGQVKNTPFWQSLAALGGR